MTPSAILGPLSVYLEYCCIFLLLKKILKTELYHSFPVSLSILSCDRFDVDRIFENCCVFLDYFYF